MIRACDFRISFRFVCAWFMSYLLSHKHNLNVHTQSSDGFPIEIVYHITRHSVSSLFCHPTGWSREKVSLGCFFAKKYLPFFSFKWFKKRGGGQMTFFYRQFQIVSFGLRDEKNVVSLTHNNRHPTDFYIPTRKNRCGSWTRQYAYQINISTTVRLFIYSYFLIVRVVFVNEMYQNVE